MTATMSTEKPSLDDLRIDRSGEGDESRGYLWVALYPWEAGAPPCA